MITSVKQFAHIRWMIKRDLPKVLKIEEANGYGASPTGIWEEEDFLRILGDRKNIGLVAERNDSVVGFVVYNNSLPNMFHIHNSAVEVESLNSGVGTALVNKLKRKLKHGKRESIETFVREYDLRAQLFLRSQGFQWVETVRSWYELPHEQDAYKFRYSLEEEC